MWFWQIVPNLMSLWRSVCLDGALADVWVGQTFIGWTVTFRSWYSHWLRPHALPRMALDPTDVHLRTLASPPPTHPPLRSPRPTPPTHAPAQPHPAPPGVKLEPPMTGPTPGLVGEGKGRFTCTQNPGLSNDKHVPLSGGWGGEVCSTGLHHRSDAELFHLQITTDCGEICLHLIVQVK